MSQFDWRNGFAVGITAGILGTVLFALALETYPGEVTAPSAESDKGGNIPPEDNRWWLVSRVIHMDDTAAQWAMTLLTIVAVVLIYLTLRDTRSMAAETTRIGEAQVRAYPNFDIGDVRIADTGPDDRGRNFEVSIDLRLRNSGQTPAMEIWANFGIGAIPVNAAGSIDGLLGEIGESEPSAMFLPAGHSGDSVGMTLSRKFRVDADKLYSGELKLGVFVILNYRDIFERNQRTPPYFFSIDLPALKRGEVKVHHGKIIRS